MAKYKIFSKRWIKRFALTAEHCYMDGGHIWNIPVVLFIYRYELLGFIRFHTFHIECPKIKPRIGNRSTIETLNIIKEILKTHAREWLRNEKYRLDY